MNFNRFKNRVILPRINDGAHTAILTDVVEDTDSKGRKIQRLVWNLTDLDNRPFTDIRNDTLTQNTQDGKQKASKLTAFENATARIRDQLGLAGSVDMCELYTDLVENKVPITLYLSWNDAYNNFDVDYLPPKVVQDDVDLSELI